MAFNDLLKQCNFQITLGQHTNLEFFVQEVTLPDVTLGDISISHWTQTESRPGDSLTWSPLNLTVICDEDLVAYKQAYDLMLKEKHPQTGVIDPLGTIFDAKLFLTTNKNNIKYVATFYNAWISSLGSLQLTTTSTEDDMLTFTIDLPYTYYSFDRFISP